MSDIEWVECPRCVKRSKYVVDGYAEVTCLYCAHEDVPNHGQLPMAMVVELALLKRVSTQKISDLRKQYGLRHPKWEN